MRLLLGLAGVLVLAGCGSLAGRSGAPAPARAPAAEAPPIVADDEAPPEEVQRMLDAAFAPVTAAQGSVSWSGSSQTVMMFSSGIDMLSPTTTVPTAAQLATINAQFEAQRAAMRPAAGSPPRVVARLPLADGGNALFMTWRNHDGLLCIDTQIVEASGGGGGGPSGPCTGAVPGETHCAALCLESDGDGNNATDTHWVLSGTVAADADALDVTTADGTTVEYPLTGPAIDGDRRVFMLDLGAQDWRKLVLLEGGQVEDEVTMPALSAASEDCEAKVGPMPPSRTEQAYEQAFQACLQASGALPALPAVPLVPSGSP